MGGCVYGCQWLPFDNSNNMENVSFFLKEPQRGIIPSKQKETLVYLFFSYGYFEITANGKKKYLPLKYSTGLRIYPYLWIDKPTYRAKRKNNFDYQSFNTKLDNLEDLIKQIYRKNPNSSPSKLRELLNKALNNEKAEVFTLNTYIDKYLIEIGNGTRLTNKAEKYKAGTVKAVKGFVALFKRFQSFKNKQYDFNDITIDFYNQFTGYLTTLNYSPNTIGRHIKHLKAIMHQAREEGHHKNTEIDNKAFRILTKKVDNIYLSEEELQKMYKLDLSHKPNYNLARDVFLVGCYTAQRYSDYSRINKNSIKGNFIELIQKKTQEKVIIPIRPQLREILEKYDYTLPKSYEQKVNKYIKEVGKLAGIDEIIETENTRGGLIVKANTPKHDLIKTHTARRSGATNMYLAGIPSIDIMKITGHKTESEFLKYIKVSKAETAQSLAMHPYFNKPLMKVN